MTGPKWEIGPDGWPISPDHPANRGPWSIPDSVEAMVVRDLAWCERAWLAGNHAALIDAIMLCSEHKVPLPNWASEAVVKALTRQLGTGGTGKRGRKATAKAALIENRKHYDRWCAVKDLRDLYGVKGEVVWWKAAKLLQGTPAFGSPATIRSSYRLVERASKAGTAAMFYIPRWFRPPT